jgi:predicted nucleic acid-binding protein
VIVALDTNVLGYLAEVDRSAADRAKIDILPGLLLALGGSHRIVVPVQALGELYNLLNKSGTSPDKSRAVVNLIAERFEPVATGIETMARALELASAHHLQIWDAVILAAARDAGARYLLTEDMQDGFEWQGIGIVNPFEPSSAALLRT